MQAAALRYDPGSDDAPVIVGLGRGFLAQKLIEKAEEYNIPVVPDKGLSDMLAKLSVGDTIPEELFEIVAQILVFVSETDKRYGELAEK